jgi:hypothetical protein
MQRFAYPGSHQRNTNVKYCYSLLLLSLTLSFACKKSGNKIEITATIAGKGPFNGTYAAWVENPDPNVYPFLCELPISSFTPYYSCRNAIFIRNLPANLSDSGTKVRITGWNDHGQPALFSSINHAHELEVKSVRRVN